MLNCLMMIILQKVQKRKELYRSCTLESIGGIMKEMTTEDLMEIIRKAAGEEDGQA